MCGLHTKHTQISAGADIHRADKYGWQPLHTAAHHGHTDVVLVLLRAGVVCVCLCVCLSARFFLFALLLPGILFASNYSFFFVKKFLTVVDWLCCCCCFWPPRSLQITRFFLRSRKFSASSSVMACASHSCPISFFVLLGGEMAVVHTHYPAATVVVCCLNCSDVVVVFSRAFVAIFLSTNARTNRLHAEMQ